MHVQRVRNDTAAAKPEMIQTLESIKHENFVDYFCANVPETELESAIRNSIHSNFLLHKIKKHEIKKTTSLKIEMFDKTTKGKAGTISNLEMDPLRFVVIDRHGDASAECSGKEALERAMFKVGIVFSNVWYNYKLVTHDGHELTMDANGSWDNFFFNLDICLNIAAVI